MVTLLCLLHHGQVALQVCLIGKRGSVNPGKHLVLLAASPVRACDTRKLKCLYTLCIHDMGSCAQVHKFALLVKAYGLLLRQIFDKLYLIRLAFFLHESDSLSPWKHKRLNRKIFLYNLSHLCL